MSIEMSIEEMEEYHTDHLGSLPLHIGAAMFGWRCFTLASYEQGRLKMLENNIAPSGTENTKLHLYISKITGINLETIEATNIQNGVLTVVPVAQ